MMKKVHDEFFFFLLLSPTPPPKCFPLKVVKKTDAKLFHVPFQFSFFFLYIINIRSACFAYSMLLCILSTKSNVFFFVEVAFKSWPLLQ